MSQPIEFVGVDNDLTDEQFRQKYLTNQLSKDEKKDFYYAVINDDLELFKSYVNGTPSRLPYNLFEEVSEINYGWTTLHYAMHYAKVEIAKYIISRLIEENRLNIAFKLKSNDGRCPLLCLLKSNSISSKVKVNTYNELIAMFDLPISDEVKERLKIEINEAKNSEEKENNPNPYPDHPYITDTLTTKEKMEFYNCVMKNELDKFEKLLLGGPNKKAYPIFEEVSAPNFYWTVFHYAMHYGKLNFINYIIEYLHTKNLLNIGLSLKTVDNRCPLLCLLKSKDLTVNDKKECFDSLITTYPGINISNIVLDELTKRGYNDIVQKILEKNKQIF